MKFFLDTMEKMYDLPENREDIIAIIDDFTSPHYWPTSVGSFAHIVLDDYNLEDGSIDFCLHPDRIDAYLKLKEESLFKYMNDYVDGLNSMVEILNMSIEIIMFLNWLKSLPEEIRERSN